MKRENLFRPFEIIVREYERFPISVHQHTFFELCYIVSGSGTFCSDSCTARFQSGALLLVKPGMEHVYDLAERTCLIYIRFSESYLKPYFTQYESGLLYAAPETMLSGWTEAQQLQLASTASCIMAEIRSSFPDDRLCRWWANCMIQICIGRIRFDMAGKEVVPVNQVEKSLLMMQYIQLHLHRPGLLRLRNLGEQFNMSEKYVGKYFKACSGESLRNYILRCRLLEAEKMLTQTDMTICEIANKLGFTDESHLNHAFKKYKNVSPRAFRKK